MAIKVRGKLIAYDDDFVTLDTHEKEICCYMTIPTKRILCIHHSDVKVSLTGLSAVMGIDIELFVRGEES
jgi:hypothetical protein